MQKIVTDFKQIDRLLKTNSFGLIQTKRLTVLPNFEFKLSSFFHFFFNKYFIYYF